MKQIQTVNDVYQAVNELITDLKVTGQIKLADILYHRMYLVAWTSGSELLEELQKVLMETLQSNDVRLPEAPKKQMLLIIEVIQKLYSRKDSNNYE